MKGYLNSDFLYANQTSPRIESPVELIFSHKLSKINITLTSTDITNLSNADIYICGTFTEGRVSAKEGFVEVYDADYYIKDIKAATTDANATASAIIIPQTITAGTAFIKIEHNNKSYYYTLSTDKTFISGNVYNYNLKLNEKDELKLVSSSINPWISSESNNTNEDIDEDLGVEIDVTNAGNLSYLIGNKKNKITSLKLTGILNESDLNFLSEMSNYNSDNKGNLRKLDLSKTTIAENKIWLWGNMLNSLVVPNDIETLQLGCEQLSSFNIPNSVKNVIVSSGTLTSIDIPKGVNNVNLSYSKALTTINIPEGVESINLSYCTALSSFEIPNGIELIAATDVYEEELSGKKWIDLYGCSSLTSITIPNSVTKIGTGAFEDCKRLASIVIPNNVTAIGEAAFSNCINLTSINIPNGVTAIEDATYAGCTSLKSVTIPSTITSIGNFAFAGCTSLSKIYCKVASPININSEVFMNVPLSTCTLYVPTGCKSAYETADYWKNFNSIVEE